MKLPPTIKDARRTYGMHYAVRYPIPGTHDRKVTSLMINLADVATSAIIGFLC